MLNVFVSVILSLLSFWLYLLNFDFKMYWLWCDALMDHAVFNFVFVVFLFLYFCYFFVADKSGVVEMLFCFCFGALYYSRAKRLVLNVSGHLWVWCQRTLYGYFVEGMFTCMTWSCLAACTLIEEDSWSICHVLSA